MPDHERFDDVVHRIKNHLSVILGFADLTLESSDIADPARGDVLEIRRAAHAALLELAKLEGVERHAHAAAPNAESPSPDTPRARD